MELVKKQASEFFEWELFSGTEYHNLENLTNRIQSKLYLFNRERDRLTFLKTLKPLIVKDKMDHIASCTNSQCGYEEPRDTAIFVIDQEIEGIETSYSYRETYNKNNAFSPEQISELTQRLNQIQEKLEKLGFGQEIIFNELDELKLHFELGKKTWFQLLKGKIIDIGIEKAIEKTMLEELWSILSSEFEKTSLIP